MVKVTLCVREKISLLFLIFTLVFFNSFISVQAAMQSHFTLFINQVRGTECCDQGNTDFLEKQLDVFESHGMKASFAIRYDALIDEQFSSELSRIKQNHEPGGFLEITPHLSAEAGVPYSGMEENWYQAHHSYLIGYTPAQREKIIDTYMSAFKKKFGAYPVFTTSWMIDAHSLGYLSEKYGVKLHQITREQFGTDSYTLYGGPPHYPYYPSEHWPLIPDEDQQSQLPIIVRQTITDPVFNYGDTTNSYTSQPNDYGLRNAPTDYFTHLFFQAHRQLNHSTFALLGVENSMPAEIQSEFSTQINIVADWKDSDSNNQVVTAGEFVTMNAGKPIRDSISLYAGSGFQQEHEQAWWITTPLYRVRLRLSQNELYISDIRIFDEYFTDPYETNKAIRQGWWIVPFVLDGSRFFEYDITTVDQKLANDGLTSRKAKELTPTRIILEEDVTAVNIVRNDDETVTVFADGQELATFDLGAFRLNVQPQYHLENQTTDEVLADLVWQGGVGEPLWSFAGDDQEWRGNVVTPEALSDQRTLFPYFLFPEVRDEKLDTQTSYVYENNVWAIAGRNPIRLVFFPKNRAGQPVYIDSQPELTFETHEFKTTVERPSGSNGMIFIDIESDQILQDTVSVTFDDFSWHGTIYFAPNCREQVFYCLTHPQKTWWYVRTVWDDRRRAREDLESK